MTNPQDIDKAFEQWYVENAHDYASNPIGSRDCGLQRKAWHAAALRAVQEPDYKVMWEGMCDYIESHWRGAGVKNTLDWALDRLASRYNSLENALDDAEAELEKLRATPPPPGAASPGVPARPPYKYSWPGDPSPD